MDLDAYIRKWQELASNTAKDVMIMLFVIMIILILVGGLMLWLEGRTNRSRYLFRE